MTATLTENVAAIMGGFIGRLPIYWRGNQIGFADFLKNGERGGIAKLCGGTLTTFVGVEHGDPREWTTYNGWGQSIPVTTYCLNHGVSPTWLTAEQKAAQTINPTTGKVTVPGVNAAGLTPGALIAAGAAALGLVLLVARR